MTYDPLSEVINEPLRIDGRAIASLTEFRSREKLLHLPGVDTALERERLLKILNTLLDELLAGIERNPSKLWALTQFQRALVQVQLEDTEAREHFGMEIEHIMDVLGIESSDGLLSFYLGGL
ncbi:MAG: DUF4844 domain-containing protein [Proteobacteria bacterium]|nr:DUF4844 domain-containing protein [Pseudomonadota bacterium]